MFIRILIRKFRALGAPGEAVRLAEKRKKKSQKRAKANHKSQIIILQGSLQMFRLFHTGTKNSLAGDVGLPSHDENTCAKRSCAYCSGGSIGSEHGAVMDNAAVEHLEEIEGQQDGWCNGSGMHLNSRVLQNIKFSLHTPCSRPNCAYCR
mmetsp:Transcript_117/g.272  ORF Transcript_117/g.272 Transcript_117/m.272 type:complete len:150 (+) Transcript_117:727-1176(+)